jgi:hypothetical protein
MLDLSNIRLESNYQSRRNMSTTETCKTRVASTGNRDSGPSISVLIHELDDDTWDGWGPEEIEAAERFDDMSAVGYYLNEKQAPMIEATKRG